VIFVAFGGLTRKDRDQGTGIRDQRATAKARG
jgi:hypothetical protein